MSGIIEVDKVTKTYRGGIVAVDDVSLAVAEGEFVTLLGPSGCGKTTTLRMIAGFETPTQGRIYLAGEDVTDLPPYRRQVNTVFQDYALFPHMTIRDNVGYGLRVSGVPRADIARRVLEALTTVGLVDKAEARPGNLSGGQKQRVALARALVRKPKVLLLDEPLSALDAKLREAMQVELKHLHRKLGLTFVFVTHDQTEALVMSDRVVVMDRGRIVQSGSPSDLYDHPATPYVANFIGTSNMIAGEVSFTNGRLTTVRFPGGEVRSASGAKRFGVGDKVIASVRPEKVHLRQDGETQRDHTVISGTVMDSLFHGDSFRLEVDIREGEPFLVDIQLKTGVKLARVPAAGSSIDLVIDPETVSLFSAETEEGA
jgi:spermidine/putrescine transport system ATP-binding protein